MTSLVSLLFVSIYDPYSNLKFLIFLILVCLFFCNIIMTGEPVLTASKGRMVPEVMFSTEHVLRL